MTILRALFQFNKKGFLSVVALTVLSGLTGSIGILLLIPMLSALNVEGESRFSALLSSLGVASASGQILLLIGIYVILISIAAVLNRRIDIRRKMLTESFVRYLRKDFYNAATHSEWIWYINYEKNVLYNSYITEIFNIGQAAENIIYLLSVAVRLAFSVFIALFISIPATLISSVLGALFFLFYKKILTKIRLLGEQNQIAREKLMHDIDQQLDSLKEVYCYHTEKTQAAVNDRTVERFEQVKVDLARLDSWPAVILNIGSVLLVAVIFILSYFILHNSFAEIAVMVYAFSRTLPGINAGQQYLSSVVAAEPSLKKVQEIVEGMRAHRRVDGKPAVPHGIPQRLEFENIVFSYEASGRCIIDHASFTVRSGRINVLMGASGMGKTTLLDIILGLIAPDSGRISLDGVPISSEDYGSYYGRIGYIPQTPSLMNESIRSNLLCFHPEATDSELTEALKKAQIWDRVSSLPQGIDAEIGDRGVRLSGGERQRIVLARALLGDPELLVLDEATSALDYENEEKIMRIVSSLTQKMTVLIVTHRLSTVQYADHFLIIADGKIRETDTYDEALALMRGKL